MNDSVSATTPSRSIAPSSKRELSSPLSPEDLPSKKNKFNMSGSENSMDVVAEEAADSQLFSLDQSQTQTHTLTLPPATLQQMSELMKPSIHADILAEIRSDLKVLMKIAVSEAIDEKLADLKADNERLTRENSALKKRVSTLEAQMDASEQYSRRNSLRISGIPETVNDDTDQIVLHVAETVGVNISPSEIDRSHRLGRPGNRQIRDILVKFTSYRARERLMKNRRNLKTSELRGVFVNEDLTKVRSKLLFEARKCVKTKHLLGAWSSDGRILVKDKKGTVAVVTCEEDIGRAIRQGD